MKCERQGREINLKSEEESFSAFVPADLPPLPPLELTTKLRLELSHADLMMGRLDGLSTLIRHPEMLITFYIQKEAVLSSQIEGTQSTLTELLLFEIEPDLDNTDTAEVSNYIRAMRHGLMRLRSGFPLSLRLIREMHEILLDSGRGSRSTPGEFRTSQNWIGGTRPGNAHYVPPPVREMHEALDAFERFIHEGASDHEVLVQCAMLHVQFESIHPFLDGNGRLGRLLITLLLIERGVLAQPLLYMSLYLKQNRDEYYRLLQSVRYEGNWEEWVSFFLNGVASTAGKAVELAKAILQLFEDDEKKLEGLGAKRGSVLQTLQKLREMPYTAIIRLDESIRKALHRQFVEDLGIVEEIPASKWRLFMYLRYAIYVDVNGFCFTKH